MFHLSQITDGNRTRVESVKEGVKSIGLAVREHLGLRALISESVATGFHQNKVGTGSGNDRDAQPHCRNRLSCDSCIELKPGLNPVATAPGSDFVRWRSSFSAKVMQWQPRKT